MSKEIWLSAIPFDKTLVTLGLESGVDGFVAEAADADAILALGRTKVMTPDAFERVTLTSKDDETTAITHLKAGRPVFLSRGWEIIPVENILAAATGLGLECESLDRARLAAGVLERGADRLLITTRRPPTSRPSSRSSNCPRVPSNSPPPPSRPSNRPGWGTGSAWTPPAFLPAAKACSSATPRPSPSWSTPRPSPIPTWRPGPSASTPGRSTPTARCRATPPAIWRNCTRARKSLSSPTPGRPPPPWSAASRPKSGPCSSSPPRRTAGRARSFCRTPRPSGWSIRRDGRSASSPCASVTRSWSKPMWPAGISACASTEAIKEG